MRFTVLLLLCLLCNGVALLPTPIWTSPRHVLRQRFKMIEVVPDDDGSGGPFSRKSLLQGVGKAAGVVGVGTFLRRGFVVGTPYTDSPDLTGKTAVITGGNTGLGKETAVRLAQLGADVTIACRSPDRATSALEDIRAQAPGAKVSSATLNLASMSSIEKFAKDYSRGVDQLDILVNNAGVMAVPDRQLTVDGFELQWGTNHLGHFRLTNLLLPKVLQSKDGRVINVSSSAHMIPQSINWDDLNASKPGSYGPWSAYGLSKLSNILFTKELQKRLDKRGGGSSTVTCMALHPGACRTELGRYIFDPSQAVNPLLLPLLGAATLVTRSPKEGAQTQICCAADPLLGCKGGSKSGGGQYFTAPKFMETPSTLARDPENALRMWKETEALVGGFSSL